MTTPIERAVKLLAGGGVLPAWLRPVVAKATGFQQIVTRGRPAASVLDLPGIDVPYLRASQALGLGAFPLALDGDAHRVARDLIGGVLAASSDAHLVGVAAAADRAEVVLSTCGSRLEVIGGLIDPCLQSWVEAWFGLPGFGPELHHVSRAITTAIFFNPALQSKRPDEDLERAVVAEVRATNDRLLPAIVGAPDGTLASVVLAASGDPEIAAGHLLGLTVGPLTLGSWSIANAVVDLLDDPSRMRGLADRDTAADAYRAAMVRRPPLPGIPRVVSRSREVLGEHGLVAIPEGPILVATPIVERLDPPSDASRPGLAFGAGAHACMGPAHIAAVAAEVLAPLVGRSPAVADGSRPRPRTIPGQRFPGALELQLRRSSPAPPTSPVR